MATTAGCEDMTATAVVDYVLTSQNQILATTTLRLVFNEDRKKSVRNASIDVVQ